MTTPEFADNGTYLNTYAVDQDHIPDVQKNFENHKREQDLIQDLLDKQRNLAEHQGCGGNIDQLPIYSGLPAANDYNKPSLNHFRSFSDTSEFISQEKSCSKHIEDVSSPGEYATEVSSASNISVQNNIPDRSLDGIENEGTFIFEGTGLSDSEWVPESEIQQSSLVAHKNGAFSRQNPFFRNFRGQSLATSSNCLPLCSNGGDDQEKTQAQGTLKRTYAKEPVPKHSKDHGMFNLRSRTKHDLKTRNKYSGSWYENRYGHNELDTRLLSECPPYAKHFLDISDTAEIDSDILHLLKEAEIHKWSYMSSILSDSQGRYISKEICKHKFEQMFGERESSTVLGSSLPYIAFDSGLHSITEVLTLGELRGEAPVKPFKKRKYDF